MKTTLLLLIAFASSSFAQTVDSTPHNDAHGSSLPGTCSVGDRFFLTGVTAGQNAYGCTASNTWTQQGGATPTASTLCSSGTASSSITATTETNLGICPITAGVMGANSHLVIAALYKFGGSTNSRNAAVRFSATSGDVSGGSVVFSPTNSASTNLSYKAFGDIWNANSTSAQIASPSGAGNAPAVVTPAINTASASYINFNCYLVSSSDSCQLMAYSVVLIHE